MYEIILLTNLTSAQVSDSPSFNERVQMNAHIYVEQNVFARWGDPQSRNLWNLCEPAPIGF